MIKRFLILMILIGSAQLNAQLDYYKVSLGVDRLYAPSLHVAYAWKNTWHFGVNAATNYLYKRDLPSYLLGFDIGYTIKRSKKYKIRILREDFQKLTESMDRFQRKKLHKSRSYTSQIFTMSFEYLEEHHAQETRYNFQSTFQIRYLAYFRKKLGIEFGIGPQLIWYRRRVVFESPIFVLLNDTAIPDNFILPSARIKLFFLL